MNGLGNTKRSYMMSQIREESKSNTENDYDNVESKLGFRQLDTDESDSLGTESSNKLKLLDNASDASDASDEYDGLRFNTTKDIDYTDNEKPIRRERFKTIYDSKEFLTYIEKVEQIKKILPDRVIYKGDNCKNDELKKLFSVSIKEELFSKEFICSLHNQCQTYDLLLHFSFISTSFISTSFISTSFISTSFISTSFISTKK